MSWYKRTPRVKAPGKPKPHRTSPIVEELLKETKKKTGPSQDPKGDKE